MAKHCSNVEHVHTARDAAFSALVQQLFKMVAEAKLTAEEAQVQLDAFTKEAA